MSDALMAEVKSLGMNLSKIGEAMTQKLDPLPGELKSMKDAIAEMQLRTQKFEYLHGAKSKTVSPEMKSFIDYVAGRTTDYESKAATATVANQNNAGYLAIPEFIDQVIPQLYERSPLLSEITVFRISGNIGSVPVANSRPEVHWVGEIEERPVSKVDVGVANIPMNEMVCSTELSNVLIRDSNLVNAEQYIQTAYFDRVLVHANRRLAEMSGGRYELVRRRDADNRSQSALDIDVVDGALDGSVYANNVSRTVVLKRSAENGNEGTIEEENGTLLGTWKMYGNGYIAFHFNETLKGVSRTSYLGEGTPDLDSGDQHFYGVVRTAWLNDQNRSGFTITCMGRTEGTKRSMSMFMNNYSTITGEGLVGDQFEEAAE